MDCTMGIDVGPSALKAAVYDTRGNQLAYCSLPTQTAYVLDPGNPEWVCWDPDIIWENIQRAISACVAQLEKAHALRAVAVTGMGMDGLPIDKSGRWIYPFISWHCTRTMPQYKSVVEKVGKAYIFERTGQQSTHIHSMYRMMWLRMNHPELYEKVDRWLLIEDFINYKLCGRCVTDLSMASTTSLMDYRRRTWSEDMLAVAQVDRSILPELCHSGQVIGAVRPEISRQTGLPEGLPVVLGGHDYTCAAYLGGIHRNNMVMDMVGSWEMLLSGANDLVNTPKAFTSGCKIDCHVVDGEYCLVGDFVSTHMVEWFNRCHSKQAADEISPEREELAKFLQDVAGAKPDAGGVFFLPALCGAGSPYVDSHARGAFVGLNDMSTRQDMARAVMESLNYQCYSVIRAMNSARSRVTSNQIVVVGGAAAQPVWMQNKADITGMAVKAVCVNDTAIRGAAKLAMSGVGLPDEGQNALWVREQDLKIYEPDVQNCERYREGFGVFNSLQSALREINHQIDARQFGWMDTLDDFR